MKPHHLEDTIELVVQGWNKNCHAQGIPKTFAVTINNRNKKVRLATADNKIQEGFVEIAELTLVENYNNINRLLYRTETPLVIPVKGRNEHHEKMLIEHKIKTQLYNSFLYECIGTFCVTSSEAFSSGQLAEYSIDLDRIKGDEEFTGIWVEVDKADETDWFKVGDKFEVFTKTPTHNWGVYSYRQDHQNGIGSIPMTKAKLVKDDVKKEVLEESGTIDENVVKKVIKTKAEGTGIITTTGYKEKKAPVKRTTKTK